MGSSGGEEGGCQGKCTGHSQVATVWMPVGEGTCKCNSKKYSIPESTLHGHAKGKVKKVGAGKPTVLTYEEEEIMYCCQVLQEIGFGLTKAIASSIVIGHLHAKQKRASF